jgi:hypothetical protein
MKKIMIFFASLIMVFAFSSCSSDNDDNNDAIVGYVGTWSCTSPASYVSNTIVEEGTKLQITSAGRMTWTKADGKTYSATMKALGDDLANITYNGKIYSSVEIYVRNSSLTINANGAASLEVKDFPFDGTYTKIN